MCETRGPIDGQPDHTQNGVKGTCVGLTDEVIEIIKANSSAHQVAVKKKKDRYRVRIMTY